MLPAVRRALEIADLTEFVGVFADLDMSDLHPEPAKKKIEKDSETFPLRRGALVEGGHVVPQARPQQSRARRLFLPDEKAAGEIPMDAFRIARTVQSEVTVPVFGSAWPGVAKPLSARRHALLEWIGKRSERCRIEPDGAEARKRENVVHGHGVP